MVFGGPPTPPGSVPPWITSGFSRVGLAKWVIRMQGCDTSRLAFFLQRFAKHFVAVLYLESASLQYCSASFLAVSAFSFTSTLPFVHLACLKFGPPATTWATGICGCFAWTLASRGSKSWSSQRHHSCRGMEG